MEETKVKAIVIGGIDYKEKDKLTTLFTLENGIVTVLFKSVKNSNAKLKSAKEIFSFGDFIYTNGANKTVISADIIDTFYNVTKDIKRYYSACAILEIVKTIMQPNEANPQLFVNSLKCLKLLAYENVEIFNVLNKFLISVFQAFGYKFDLNACNNCGEKFLNHRYMNLSYGDITCYNCQTGNCIEISRADYSALRILSITSFEKLSTIKISKETLSSVYNILLSNFKARFSKVNIDALMSVLNF